MSEAQPSEPRRPAHPGLYRVDRDPPVLLGQRCAGCERLSFPPNPYGCERCGSEVLEPVEIEALGTLRAFARVHLHAGKDIEAPFVVGSVALDAGPVIRATLTCATEDGLSIGDRVRAALVPRPTREAEGSAALLELRFAVDVDG